LTELKADFRSVILAGERPGGSPLSLAFNVPASVMVPVAGKPALARVMQAIDESQFVEGGVICGPAAEIVANSKKIKNLLLLHPDHEWLDQSTGPAASASSALEKLNHYPVLLTAGDHALLTGKIVDEFCSRVLSCCAGDTKPDLVIGFVPYPLVKAAWPQSRRTVLKFSNGQFCGSNLFAIVNPQGRKALSFWRQAEADRKQPWRIARRVGFVALIRYLFKCVTIEETLVHLSKAAGCHIGYIQLNEARAAVDVDSIEDQKLAESILSGKS